MIYDAGARSTNIASPRDPEEIANKRERGAYLPLTYAASTCNLQSARIARGRLDVHEAKCVGSLQYWVDHVKG